MQKTFKWEYFLCDKLNILRFWSNKNMYKGVTVKGVISLSRKYLADYRQKS